MRIEFIIPKIVVQTRPRFVFRSGRVWAYYDKKTKKNREMISALVKLEYPDIQPTRDLYHVEITVYLPSLKSKIDLDNVGKIILDSLTGIIWENDKQVFSLYMKKSVIKKKKPHIKVVIDKMGGKNEA